MIDRRHTVLLALVAILTVLPVHTRAAGTPPGFRMDILIDGRPMPEYRALGTRYVEALKGRTYAIRLSNPLDVRVAVALSVDGLNTIDARHTTPAEGRKWVLGPHETVTISGWQTNLREARRFFFTTEDQSYADRLGRPENIGVISAVFFRERVVRIMPLGADAVRDGARQKSEAPAPQAPRAEGAAGAAPAPSPSARAQKPAEDDFAATGMGDRTDHAVRQVHVDLEPFPAASIDTRYEYRAQLVRLGVLPDDRLDPLSRRQRARGFDDGFCPVVK